MFFCVSYLSYIITTFISTNCYFTLPFSLWFEFISMFKSALLFANFFPICVLTKDGSSLPSSLSTLFIREALKYFQLNRSTTVENSDLSPWTSLPDKCWITAWHWAWPNLNGLPLVVASADLCDLWIHPTIHIYSVTSHCPLLKPMSTSMGALNRE